MDKHIFPPQFYVSITGLKPKGFFAGFRFLWHAIPSKMQADKAEGLLFSGVRKINGIQHTLTAWKSKEDMQRYIRSGAHLKAMKVFRQIATGKTFGFEASALPAWEEVHELWQKHGREY